MNGWELKTLIDQNNIIIEGLLQQESFVLNKEILDLCNKNNALRKICIHEFENNICKFCSTNKENQ